MCGIYSSIPGRKRAETKHRAAFENSLLRALGRVWQCSIRVDRLRASLVKEGLLLYRLGT